MTTVDWGVKRGEEPERHWMWTMCLNAKETKNQEGHRLGVAGQGNILFAYSQNERLWCTYVLKGRGQWLKTWGKISDGTQSKYESQGILP